jgi:hypothetical protein
VRETFERGLGYGHIQLDRARAADRLDRQQGCQQDRLGHDDGHRARRRWRDRQWMFVIAAIGAVVVLLAYDVVEASLRKVDTGFVRPVSKDNPGHYSDDVLNPRSDIDTVAPQTAIGLFDHIAEMNANAKFDANAGSRSPNPDSQTMLKRRWPDSVKANR